MEYTSIHGCLLTIHAEEMTNQRHFFVQSLADL